MKDTLGKLLESVGLRFMLALLLPGLLVSSGGYFVAAYVDWAMGDSARATGAINAFEEATKHVAFWTWGAGTAWLFAMFNHFIVQIWEGYPWLRASRLLNRIAGDRWLLRRRSAQNTPNPLESDDSNRLDRSLRGELPLGTPSFPLRQAMGQQYRNSRLPRPTSHRLKTALGRILDEMETAPRRRYGIEPLDFWPRLAFVSPDVLAPYTQAKTWLDACLHTATSMLVVAIYGLSWLPVSPYAAVMIAILLTLAYACYRASLPTARTMCIAVENAFDLRRGDLLKAWSLRQPRPVEDEQAVWRALGNFLTWSDPRLFPEEFRLRSPKKELD